MTNSWSSNGERRDRGRIDRGVNKPQRSRSPIRPPRGRDHSRESVQRDPTQRRARQNSPLPVRSRREEERRRRSSPPPLAQRRRSRSPSVNRIPLKKQRDRRSPDRRISPVRERLIKHELSDRRQRSPSPRRDRRASRGRSPPRYPFQRERSPNRSPNRFPPSRRPSPIRDSSKKRRRDYSEDKGRKSAKVDRDELIPRFRRSSKGPQGSTPSTKARGKNRRNRDENRAGQTSSAKSSRSAASGANSVEINMNHRGSNYGGHPGFTHQNQQMQAAFPLNPQYTQQPQNYAQSPQHTTPAGSSYHGSPQAQSPYPSNLSGFQQHQQFSPQQQYSPNYAQATYGPPTGPPAGPPAGPPTGPQAHFHPSQSNSPQYHQHPPHNYQAQNYRGNHNAGFQQNQYGRNRANHRGRGNHFQNQVWTPGGPPPPSGPGRGQHNNSGSSTPQHNHMQPFNARNSDLPSQHASPQPAPPEDDENENPFRPSKDLQVEDSNSNSATSDKIMPPPERPPPTGPQAQSKFSFKLGGLSKPQPAAKPEISQKLTTAPSAGPPRREPPSTNHDRDRGVHPSRAAQLNADPDRLVKSPSSRSRPEPREPREPATRKVKKIMKREKPRPTLSSLHATSDSVYYRKPGNESVVGSGTYGKVFKGTHVYMGSEVALKKIRMEGERDGFPVTAVREIKLLQSLKHENIVKLHEVMVERNDCFMVFEYLSHDLTGILNHPTFKLQDFHKKDLAKQMFEGLDYLHRKGVLHRDIKAANILVSNKGQLKIADFGLARFYAKRRQLDYTNRVVTIWYRSPELLLGETQYGPAVDIWSAACVLVEIFTRHAIFPGDGTEMNQLDKIYAILGTPTKAEWPGLIDMAWFELLRPPSKKLNVLAEKYKERVSPAAYELLEAMFQYDPAKRPSASDVLEHPYFTTEEPAPKAVTELEDIPGDWHEYESKALRKDNERKDKEAKKALQKEALAKEAAHKKRSLEGENLESSDTKRQQTGALSNNPGATAVAAASVVAP